MNISSPFVEVRRGVACEEAYAKLRQYVIFGGEN